MDSWFPWQKKSAPTTDDKDGDHETAASQQQETSGGDITPVPTVLEENVESAPRQSSSLDSRTVGESNSTSVRTHSREAAILFPTAKSFSRRLEDEAEDDETTKPSRCYEILMKHPVSSFCLGRFPRTCAIFIGVIVPMFALIFVSMGFGAKLCQYEAPSEIRSNDEILEQVYFATRLANRITNLTRILPRFCVVLWMNNTNLAELDTVVNDGLRGLLDNTTWRGLDPISTAEDTLLVPNLGAEYPDMRPQQFENRSVVSSAESYFDFMSSCGDASQTIADEILTDSMNDLIASSVDLTFNWIRCWPGATGSRSFRGGQLTTEERTTEGQTKWYSQVWERNRQELFVEYFHNLVSSGMPADDAVTLATRQSAEDATGASGCDYNAPAAAWFWFTVQTTVGYGNQAPSSSQGRALVFTIGFISIIAFGGILTLAGTILSYLYDDFVTRNGFSCLAMPLTASVIWGLTYYAWMAVIAYITIVWKQKRLDISFPWNDSYWFSYISTTTVGLGDYFLEPEGITGADMCYFPIIFLVGFMMLAAFLGKFAEFIFVCMSRSHKSFVETLLEKRVRWRDTFAKNPDGDKTDNQN